MSIFLGAVKSKKFVPAFVFNVYDYEGFDEGKRPKLIKRETIRRSNRNAAIDFIENKYSHPYHVELYDFYFSEEGKKEFLKRNKK